MDIIQTLLVHQNILNTFFCLYEWHFWFFHLKSNFRIAILILQKKTISFFLKVVMFIVGHFKFQNKIEYKISVKV